MKTDHSRLSEGELDELKRWDTPIIYNVGEQITRQDAGRDGFNLEPTHDFMPQMGPMAGYAVTVQFAPGNEAGKAVGQATREKFAHKGEW